MHAYQDLAPARDRAPCLDDLEDVRSSGGVLGDGAMVAGVVAWSM
ncbi:hypothetical protein ACH4MT_32595 [Streptomyces anulatus]